MSNRTPVWRPNSASASPKGRFRASKLTRPPGSPAAAVDALTGVETGATLRRSCIGDARTALPFAPGASGGFTSDSACAQQAARTPATKATQQGTMGKVITNSPKVEALNE